MWKKGGGKEEDRSHVVALSNTYTLGNFTYFLVDFEHNREIGIHCLDGSNELGWGTILLKNL